MLLSAKALRGLHRRPAPLGTRFWSDCLNVQTLDMIGFVEPFVTVLPLYLVPFDALLMLLNHYSYYIINADNLMI